MQWNVGMSAPALLAGRDRRVGYVGSKGDYLIQPVDINQPQPADVVRARLVNLARPFLGYGSHQPPADDRPQPLPRPARGLPPRRRRAPARFSVAYTLSQSKTTASNDRDAVDLPQNPQDLDAEYALARTDRTHVFKAQLGLRAAGVPQFLGSREGAPRRLAGRRHLHPRVGAAHLAHRQRQHQRRAPRPARQPAERPVRERAGRQLLLFNPAAFAPPADGAYGNTGRAIFRLPGRNQWDITLSKFWNTSQKTRLQFRADFINAFNQTQFTTINNVCGAGLTDSSCAIANNTFGQFDGVRLAREIQLSLKLFFN